MSKRQNKAHPGITVEDMKQGVSKIRNPVIARVFRELNLIEQWGSGVPRIFRETYISPARQAGLIEYIIPEKPTSRFQKYRLTDKGKELLE